MLAQVKVDITCLRLALADYEEGEEGLLDVDGEVNLSEVLEDLSESELLGALQADFELVKTAESLRQALAAGRQREALELARHIAETVTGRLVP